MTEKETVSPASVSLEGLDLAFAHLCVKGPRYYNLKKLYLYDTLAVLEGMNNQTQ